MSEQKTKNRKRNRKRTYIPRNNAICVTMYSLTGEKIPKAVIDEATNAINDVALRNGYVISLAEV